MNDRWTLACWPGRIVDLTRIILSSLMLCMMACPSPSEKHSQAPLGASDEGVSRWLPVHHHALLEKRAPSRVVSMAPSLTEFIISMGARDKLVGVTRFCRELPGVEEIPSVGGFNDPSLEAVLGLRPDLVVAVPSPGNRHPVEALARLGVNVAILDDSSLPALLEATSRLGELIHVQEEAQALRACIEADLERLRRSTASLPSPSVLLVLGHRPLVVAGQNSLPHQLLDLAGATSALPADLKTVYPVLGMEQLLSLSPEVIIDASGEMAGGKAPYGKAEATAPPEPRSAVGNNGIALGGQRTLKRWWSRWPSLPAVRDGRVHIMPDASLLRPGARVAHSAGAFARAIHPGLDQEEVSGCHQRGGDHGNPSGPANMPRESGE